MSVTTTIEQQNVEIIRRGFTAFSEGDLQGLSSLFREDAEWHTPVAGVVREPHYRGRDAIFAMFATLKQETGGTYAAKPVSVAASGANVFVRAEASGMRNGRAIRTDEVLIFRVLDGRVKDVRLYLNDFPEFERAWS
jgi:ketosteroid isomerase-like protein